MTRPLSALAQPHHVATSAEALRSIEERSAQGSMPSVPLYQSAGEIVARRDLSDEVVLRAVAERLAFEGRDPKQARVVLDAALQGKKIAVNFVRSLALPMPAAPLEMPVQALLADKPPAAPGSKRKFLFFSW